MTAPRERTGSDMYWPHRGQRVVRKVGVWYPKRATTVCANNLVIRMEHIDDAVLTTIGGEVLSPKIIKAVIAGVNDAIKRPTLTARPRSASAPFPTCMASPEEADSTLMTRFGRDFQESST